jgi:DNA-binding GntR family transcriptional regulator
VTRTTASARVVQSLKDDITAGRLKVGDRLPTRRELCAQYGIAAMTAARVVRELVEEGLAISDIGRGVFITAVPEPLQQSENQPAPTLKDLAERVAALEEWRRTMETSEVTDAAGHESTLSPNREER